jgi:methyl-accepting chemotaxis protein/methyl-accepting chemotaxis protein-1 (serine sensor receptor)
MKSNWTVGKKLGISFGALIVLISGLGLSSLSALSNLHAALATTASKTARKSELAAIINQTQAEMAAAERSMVMFTLAKQGAEVESAERRFQDELVLMTGAVDELRALVFLPEVKSLLSQIGQETDEWKANLAQITGLLRAGNAEEAVKLSSAKDSVLQGKIRSDAASIAAIQKRINAEAIAAGTSLADSSSWIAMAFVLAGFGVGVAVLLIIRRVSRSLRQLAAQLSDGAEQVAGAAGQVSASGQSLAQGSSEQAASLEETSASSEEISAMTQRNAEHSKSAAQLMVATTESVNGANRKMQEMVSSMKEITASSGKISKIIKVIDEIAFQTNILALNAAVEAARAGEAGLGFAVVADEVRNLAQRSAQAARDTAELIEESISRSNDGSSRLAEVSHAIGAITEQSTQVKVLVDEIHTGSQEQSRGIEQVAGALSQMQQVTQSSAASAEQSAAAGQELASQANTLKHLVEELNALVGKSDAKNGAPGRQPQAASRRPQSPERDTAIGRYSQPTAMARPSQDELDSFPLDEVLK